MSKVTILAGLQWGDEGKGKIVDILSSGYDIVARYQGGANAGHTIVFNNKKYVLHLIPSGIFSEGIKCVIGNGTVIDLTALLEEKNFLESEGISLKNRIFISSNAHIILPYHKILDSINESSENKIGTTKKGIGPAYFDKYARRGIKLQDISKENLLSERIKTNLTNLKKIFPDSKELNELIAEKITDDLIKDYEIIKEFIADTEQLLNEEIKSGKNVLLEGAQGALLDVDFGTYPYITSSHPTSGGACIGTGIPPTAINNVIGIFKAYTTRVGEGPFPTELFDENGKRIAQIGNEFGATTGRPRRCGWLDLVALKYTCSINGVKELSIMKSDVLDDFEEICICTGYEYNGKMYNNFITDCDILKNIKPVYKKFKGWKTDLKKIFEFNSLPEEFKTYLDFIETETGVKIKYISTGASREQIIIRN
jgi:adenylosuccinate synthase